MPALTGNAAGSWMRQIEKRWRGCRHVEIGVVDGRWYRLRFSYGTMSTSDTPAAVSIDGCMSGCSNTFCSISPL